LFYIVQLDCLFACSTISLHHHSSYPPSKLLSLRAVCEQIDIEQRTFSILSLLLLASPLKLDMAGLLRKAPPLLVPGASSSSLRLVAQTPFDPSSTSEPPYVLHVVPFNQGYLFGGSDDSIRAFSPTLQPLGTLKSTQKGITSLAAGSGKDSNVAFVTARDGTVAGWDLRDLTKEAFKIKGESLSVLSEVLRMKLTQFETRQGTCTLSVRFPEQRSVLFGGRNRNVSLRSDD